MKAIIFSTIAFMFLASFSLTEAAIIGKPVNNIGLVGYWSFNEGSGTVAGDSSGSQNTGALVGTIDHVAGTIGNAIDMDGTDYVVVPNAASLNPTNGLTISAWINADDWSDNHRIVQKGDNDDQYRLTQEGAVFRFDLGGVPSGGVAISPPSAGVWHHVVATYNGVSLVIYIDGAVAGSQAASGPIATTPNNLHIGTKTAAAPPGDHFPGLMDEVRIYNRGLTAAEVASLYRNRSGSATVGSTPKIGNGSSLKNGLVGHWTFDNQNITTSIVDSSGNGNNGGMIGAATSSAKIAGKLGQALKFNGSNLILLGSPASLDNLDYITISAWVKPDVGSDGGEIFAKVNNGCCATYGPDVWLMPSGGNLYSLHFAHGFASGFNDWAYDNVVTAGQWNHIVVTYSRLSSSNVPTFYVNGVLYNPTNTQGGGSGAALDDSGENAAIGVYGADTGRTGYFEGPIDDVRIYNRMLSATEVKQLYALGGQTINSSVSKLQNGSSISSGLVGYWTFDNLDFGTAIVDKSGNGNSGYIVNGSTSSAKVAGKLGQGLRLDGVNDYITMGNNSSLEVSLPVTISVWLKLSALGDYVTVLTTDSTGVGGVYGGASIQVTNSNIIKISYNCGGGGCDRAKEGTTVLQANRWYHVAGVVRGENDQDIYIDGVNDGGSYTSNGVLNTIYYSSGPATMGDTSLDNTETFNGSLDDVRVYNRALSASEVKQLYNLGK